MILPLTLSSIAAGAIATGVMVLFLYLPLLWNGVQYDTLGALGSILTRRVDARARVIGGGMLLLGGVAFAAFYGWAVLMFADGGFSAPDYTIFPGWPVPVNLFYPLMGLVMGLGQGIFVALITTFIVIDVHPVTSMRDPFPLILSYIVGHVVYGATVMFFQSQFLPLLIG